MAQRIVRIHIAAFRGIATRLTLDLHDSAGPCSMLLVGDNGSGKSSVADALEFALQARIGRHKSLTSSLAPSAPSLASPSEAPNVEIEFEDGTTHRRELRGGDVPYPDDRSHPLYAYSAFVLRRADILRFLERPEEDRQLIFSDYFGGRGRWHGSLEERAREWKAKKANLRSQIEGGTYALCDRMRWARPKSFLDRRGFDAFVERHLSRTDIAGRGIRVRVPGAAQREIDRVRSLIAEYRQTATDKPESGGPDVIGATSLVRDVLSKASEALSRAFAELSTAPFVERIEISTEPEKKFSLRVTLHTRGGHRRTPAQVLSEANQDLLSFLVFVSLIEQAQTRGQAAFLVLDDVFQSVDSTVRLRLMEYVLTRLGKWQLLVTAHDRLWAEQLRALMARCKHRFVEYEIVRWSLSDGPLIRGARADDDGLRGALARGELESISTQAGRLQELIADRLSWILPISVERKRGDRYTLGDLWPGIVRALRKSSIAHQVEAADRWTHQRNLVGAHVNEWSKSLSLAEAERYGTAVLALLASVRCSSCGRWIERSHAGWSCRCGEIHVAERVPVPSA